MAGAAGIRGGNHSTSDGGGTDAADGLVFAHARVNDHAGWFILDIASQGFIVDRDHAQQMALQSRGGYVAW